MEGTPGTPGGRNTGGKEHRNTWNMLRFVATTLLLGAVPPASAQHNCQLGKLAQHLHDVGKSCCAPPGPPASWNVFNAKLGAKNGLGIQVYNFAAVRLTARWADCGTLFRPHRSFVSHLLPRLAHGNTTRLSALARALPQRSIPQRALCIAQWCAHVHAIQRLFGAAISPSHEEVALLLHAMM